MRKVVPALIALSGHQLLPAGRAVTLTIQATWDTVDVPQFPGLPVYAIVDMACGTLFHALAHRGTHLLLSGGNGLALRRREGIDQRQHVTNRIFASLLLLLLQLFAVPLSPLYRRRLVLDGIDGVQHPVVVVLDDIVEILQEF